MIIGIILLGLIGFYFLIGTILGCTGDSVCIEDGFEKVNAFFAISLGGIIIIAIVICMLLLLLSPLLLFL